MNIKLNGSNVRSWFSSESPPKAQEGELGYLIDTQQLGIYRNNAWQFWKSELQVLGNILTVLEEEPEPVETDSQLVDLLQQIADQQLGQFATGLLPVVGSIGGGAAHSVGDAIGTGQPITLPASGYITEIEVLDLSDQGSGMVLALFSAPIATAPTDNSAFAPTDGDLVNYVGHINVAASDFSDWNANRGGTTHVPDKQFVSKNGVLYGYWVSAGTPTIAANSMPSFRLRGYTNDKSWTG